MGSIGPTFAPAAAPSESSPSDTSPSRGRSSPYTAPVATPAAMPSSAPIPERRLRADRLSGPWLLSVRPMAVSALRTVCSGVVLGGRPRTAMSR